MPEQLSFPMPPQENYGRDSYVVGQSNEVAFATVSNSRDWPPGMLMLVGPNGSGKTHLSHIFAAETGGAIISGSELAGDVDQIAVDPLVVDNADQIVDQDALFHLYNLMKARQLPLLFTASQAPSRWSLDLADASVPTGTPHPLSRNSRRSFRLSCRLRV